jgi:hypothetical protein
MTRPATSLAAIRSAVALLLLVAPATRSEPPIPDQQPPAAAPTSPSTQPDSFVTIVPGDMPLLLSAPHGGTLKIPGVERRTGNGISTRRGAKPNFSLAFDRNADKLALRVSEEIFKRTGHHPYLVIARFTRQQIDANRTAEDAYESPLAKPVYDEYHAALLRFRTEILANYHRGLLVDIHGHGGDPTTLIRGTADWQTVRHLVEEFGKDALTGPDGLLAPLAAAGNNLVPKNADNDAPEDRSLNGGYIVRHYGSFEGSNFDAIQFETGGVHRSAAGIDKFGPELADALVKFEARYLVDPPTTSPSSSRPAAAIGRPATRP